MKPEINYSRLCLSILLVTACIRIGTSCQPKSKNDIGRREEVVEELTEQPVEMELVNSSIGEINVISTTKELCAGTEYEALITADPDPNRNVESISWKHAGARGFKALQLTGDNLDQAQLVFRASGGRYNDEGKCPKKWLAKIDYVDESGNRSSVSDTIEYAIVKPQITVASDAEEGVLYKNCGNLLDVQVPCLNDTYHPVFGVTGGRKIMGVKKGKVTIVPNASEVVMTVSSGGALVGKKTFSVKQIPAPSVQILHTGRPVNISEGFEAPGPRSLDIKVIPDQEFKEMLPKDARYMAVEGKVSLMRNGEEIEHTRISGGKSNLSAIRGNAKTGDKLVVNVTRVVRRNFLGQTETVEGLGAFKKEIPIH